MPVYRTKGTLTGTIPAEAVRTAQEYLLYDHEGNPNNMHRYLDPPLEGNVVFLEWTLEGDGHSYYVTAVTVRELDAAELEQLSSEVSGQNSDGLGEGFEQQDFAWADSEGAGWNSSEDEYEENDGHMISFDWETNELPWERIG